MWVDPNTGDVARLQFEIRNLRPCWSGPSVITDDMIAALGFVPVLPAAPAFDPIYQNATELAPALVDGTWTQQWKITQLDDDTALVNLQAARNVKSQEINDARLAANFSTFSYAGKEIACDTLSRSDIDGTNGYIALFGQFQGTWPGGWKTVDNGVVPIATVDDWKAFYAAMYNQGQANFAKAQALKKQLASATTTAQIAAITWDAPV